MKNKKQRKKEFTGHVDLATGKIYGCKKGSWKWYHEQGHIKFNDQKSWYVMLRQYIFNLWMITITIGVVYRIVMNVAIILIGLYIFSDLYEENWCNQYANSKTKHI